MSAPATRRPSGPVTTTVNVTVLGSFFAENRYADPVSVTCIVPEPRRTVIVSVLGLPAGSVLVIVSVLIPLSRPIRASNRPSLPATAVADVPLLSLRTRTVLAACVLPFTVTADFDVDALSLGELILMLGRDWSRIQSATADSSLSPPGPTIEAWMLLRPFSSSTSWITRTEVGPTGTSSTICGSLSLSVTHSRTVYPSAPATLAGTFTVTSTTSSLV